MSVWDSTRFPDGCHGRCILIDQSRHEKNGVYLRTIFSANSLELANSYSANRNPRNGYLVRYSKRKWLAARSREEPTWMNRDEPLADVL